MTEATLRDDVLETFRTLQPPDAELVFAAAKGILELRALSDPHDVAPAVAALDALLQYFRRRPS